MEINGKVAIVTGGASGLGLATAENFVALGAKVAVFDLNDQNGAQVEKKYPGKVLYVRTNVADEQSVKDALKMVQERLGNPHIVINCAGIGNAAKTLGKKGPFPFDEFQKVINVNLNGTFNVIRLAAEYLAENAPLNADGDRGVIINTASVAAFDGQIGQAAYSASKGGVVGMTLPIARDLSSYGIRVNTIAPGLINTPLFQSLSAEAIQSLEATVLYPKRLGRPSEYASLVQHLVENDYINGETIRMDGGIRMQPR